MNADSGRQNQNARKILRTVTIPGSVVALYREFQLFKNLNMKTQKNKK
jgi:hypothetical protein